MNRARPFEKSMRRLALSRLRSVPRQWQRYRVHRGWLWSGWLPLRILALVGLALGVAGLLVLIVGMFFGLPFAAGFAVVRPGRDAVFASVLPAFVAFLVATGHGSWLVYELLCSRTLAVASQLPISDAGLLQHRLRRSLQGTAFIGIAAVSYFAGVISNVRLPVAVEIQILLLSIVEWLTIATLAVIIPAYFARYISQKTVGMLIGFGGASIPLFFVAAQLKIVPAKSLAAALLTLLPTGWPLLLLRHGILGGRPVAWWLLGGVGVLIVLAWRGYERLKRRYVVTEITFGESAIATAILDGDDVTTDTEPDTEPNVAQDGDLESARAMDRLRKWLSLKAPEGTVVEVSLAKARQRVLSGEFLERFEWSKGGWLERMVGNVLSDRERRVAEIFCAGQPRWSHRLMVTSVYALSAIVVLHLVQAAFGRMIMMASVYIALGASIGMLSGSWPAAIWRARSGHVCSVLGLLPIKFHEFQRAVLVLGALRGLVLLPFLAAIVCVMIYGITGQWKLTVGATYGGKAALCLVALHQWACGVLVPVTSSRRWWQLVGDAGLVIMIFAIAIAGAVVLFFSWRSEAWSLLGAAILFGTGWAVQKGFHRALVREAVDFVAMRNTGHPLQQPQLQKPPSSW